MSREFLKAKAHAEIDRIFATGGVTHISVEPEIQDDRYMLGVERLNEELTIRISATYPTPKAPDA